VALGSFLIPETEKILTNKDSPPGLGENSQDSGPTVAGVCLRRISFQFWQLYKFLQASMLV